MGCGALHAISSPRPGSYLQGALRPTSRCLCTLAASLRMQRSPLNDRTVRQVQRTRPNQRPGLSGRQHLPRRKLPMATWLPPNEAHKSIERYAKSRPDRVIRRRTDTLNAPDATNSPPSPVERAFQTFWSSLTHGEQAAFEEEAIQRANTTKREGYRRLQRVGGARFEQYRQIVLLDHFARTSATNCGD